MKVGTIAPKKFIARLRKEKVEFDNYMQQVTMILLDQKMEEKTKTDLNVHELAGKDHNDQSLIYPGRPRVPHLPETAGNILLFSTLPCFGEPP